MTALQNALQNFIKVYHGDAVLPAEQSEWHCALRLRAEDTGENLDLRISGGRVEEKAAPTEFDLVISAESTVLLEILNFQRDPNEAYLFGELTVQGPEEHFLRLDYVVTRLCA